MVLFARMRHHYTFLVRDTQNHVNAVMFIQTDKGDTSISYLCDWQYSKFRTPAQISQAKDIAMFFMLFDRKVYGHEKFDVLDSALFRKDNKKAITISFNNTDSSNTNGFSTYTCTSYTITYYHCPAPVGSCNGYQGECDGCFDYCRTDDSFTICNWVASVSPPGNDFGGGGTPPPDNGSGSNIGGSGNNDVAAPPSNNDGLRPGWRWAGKGLFNTPPEADEKELGVSDFSPQNLWWDDNIFDQNVDYKKQTKPSWDNVFKNYPKNSSGGDLDVSNVCALIGGELSNSGITNACAIRVSRALNYSGITIPEIVGQTKKGGDGKNYFLYASHLKNWLSKVLGPPDIHKKVSEIGIDPSKYYDHLIGIQNRGIYIMKPKSAESFGATGHATLWGGLDCIGGKNYFGAASDVYIWRLPQ